jgi:predicted nucleic acid-binding protein
MTMAEALLRGARDGRLDELARSYDVLGIGEPPRIAGEARALAQPRAATGMKLPDCCVLLVAHELGGRLATFDSALARIARSRGISLLDGTSGGDA